MKEVEYYFLSYSDRLNRALAGTRGRVLELGAGSCGLSLCLSRLENIKQITCADISILRMEKLTNVSASILVGNTKKIQHVTCDFNVPLMFDDCEYDAVVFDASLHHSRSMWGTLAECNRILRKGGCLVAQRESYLSAFRSKKQLAKLLKTPEVAAQVSENMYLLEQYMYYLNIAGFRVEFLKRSYGSAKKALSFLNGFMFANGVLFCHKL